MLPHLDHETNASVVDRSSRKPPCRWVMVGVPLVQKQRNAKNAHLNKSSMSYGPRREQQRRHQPLALSTS